MDLQVVQRRLDSDESQKEILFNFDRSPPPIEIHIKSPQVAHLLV